MKEFLRSKIRTKLKNYRVALNEPDETKPLQHSGGKKIAVVGGGIAGISAASNLAERGFQVTLFEKENYLGGKLGAWTFESHGETLHMEHGFHAFFRQYYNLLDFMKRLGIYENLIPIDDYVILFGKGEKQGFNDLDPTPGFNVLDLKKHGVFGWSTLLSPLSMPFLHLLRFDAEKTFRKFDGESFESYARRTLMPRKMRLVFNSFARAFFSEPHKMSMAELIKGFHFYFLSNEDGLLYDVLNDDFYRTFLKPCEDHLKKHGARLKLNQAVHSIERSGNQFLVQNEAFDYVVLCTDVKHIKQVLGNSGYLRQFSGFSKSLETLKQSDRYAVLRVWTDRFETDKLPFFVFTDRLRALDSITLYHRMEKTSAEWSRKNNGGIFELHSYALPEDLTDDEEIKKVLLQELYHYLPELEGMSIRHAHFQHRHDFPAFHTGQYSLRPTIKTEVPGLYLAGDWVKQDNCTMLMEAAYTSGATASNCILEEEGLRANLLYSVPQKGLFA
jgi:isorenieratene synthase